MPRRKVIKGSGITQRSIKEWNLEDQQDVDDWIEHEKSLPHPSDYEAHARPVVEWAQATLREAQEAGRRWAFEDDSPESYAQRIDHYDGIVRDRIRKGDASGAARWALMVGQLVGEAAIKFRWEVHALLGESGRRKSSSGGTKSAKAKRERAAQWQARIKARARRMLEAGKSDLNIAALLAPNVNRSVERVSRYVASLRKARTKK